MSEDITEPAGDLVVRHTDDLVEVALETAVEDDGTEATETGLARRGQRGMVSAEWAVGIVAAVAIAGVLLAVITSGPMKQALLKFLLWVIETFVSVVS